MKHINVYIKTVGLLVLNWIFFRISSPLLLTGLILAAAVLMFFLPKHQTLYKRIKAMAIVFIFVAIFQLIFNQSQPIVSRLLYGYLIALKLALVSFSVLIYITITSTAEIISLFWFLPEKFRLLATMTFYFIPLIMGESEQILMVQKSRGVPTKGIQGLKLYIALLIPLLHRIFYRADTVSLTMVSRGYE